MTRPSAEDLQSFYPQAALALQIEGRAAISCIVAESGGLGACGVTAESPPELGFGPAAVRMASGFKMRPMTKDGMAVGGGRVTIPINFRLPPRTPARGALKPVEPEALDLARRLLAIPQFSERLQQGVVVPDDGVTPPKTRAAASEILNAVTAAHRQDIFEFTARSLASILNRDELQAVVNYMILGQPPELPRGETAEQFNAKLDQFWADAAEVAESLEEKYAAESRAIFCKTRVCALEGLEGAPAVQAPP